MAKQRPDDATTGELIAACAVNALVVICTIAAAALLGGLLDIEPAP